MTRPTPPVRCAGLLAAALLVSACQGPAGDVLPISQVQGPGPTSPLVGQDIVVEGVVTADFREGLGGFFIQSADGQHDVDDARSAGLFIAWTDPVAGLAVGQQVRVHGQVTEIGAEGRSLTALDAARVEGLGPGRASPVVLSEAPGHPDDWERWEGMWVRIDAPLTLAGHYGLARFGEVVVAFDGRLHQPTNLARPGPEAAAIAADNQRRRLLLDDGRSDDQHRDPAYLPLPTPEAPLRTGSVLTRVEGIVDQRNGRYRLQVVGRGPRVEQAPRPVAPRVEGEFTVASVNLENLFNGDGQGGGFPTARGARTHAEYLRQQARLAAMVQALSPDVVALSEVENDGDGPTSALAQFVDALNATGPARDWRFVAAGAGAGTDPIRVALVYRGSRMTRVGEVASLLGGPFDNGSRPPLAAAFRRGEATPVVVVANHFKSKGRCPQGDAADGPDADQGDGQACWNAHRVEAADRLDAWLASDPTQTGSDHVVIAGDLNSNGQEDPIHLLRERGWVDAFEGEATYSFVFDGMAGRLDHALLSPALAGRLRGAAKWHNNADELQDWFGYEACAPDRCDGPWAVSDHDPLLIGLDP